ncbi:amidase signature domain-containing protein [Aspergillus minisclerotigenes]|uniref:amidase n=1 Tax=Aspergillus minisclerotigenes TaxID=656917 RepID=A0A5N6JCA4_9EURO|nr:amidase signature domain-containing protein [Aspergillus minisclerotigenes]
MTIPDWQQKAAAKQAEAAAKIPKEWRVPASILENLDNEQEVLTIPQRCGILTPKELEITETVDATALRDKLTARELTAVEVTTAFCKRAAIAQQITSCLTETMFPQALARAKELDEYLQTTGKPFGPLHGVPISLKETFNVQGVHSSLGLVSFLDRPKASQNSALVDILLSAGAVLYVKTNVPQTMMTADSENNVFGRVLNPHRRNITAGGSSGGEGALIALRGSLLGIGTDIAGSIRIPALCCGTFGFKPSVGRVPYSGQASAARPGMTGIAPVAGPLCHSARDAELLLRVVMNAPVDDLDDNVLGFPWIEPAPLAVPTLTIGVLPEDPQIPLHPNMQRILKAAVESLAAAGHRIVDLSGQIQCINEASDISFRFFRIDPDQTQVKHVSSSGEPFIKSLHYTYNLEGNDPEPTLRDLFDLNVERAKVATIMRRVYVENKLDVIIGPGNQSCAGPHDTYGIPVYTVLANLVDYPACVIPFGKANEVADAEYVRDVAYIPPYCPKEVENAPCHVQLIGRRLKDERLMQHAKAIESVLARKST